MFHTLSLIVSLFHDLGLTVFHALCLIVSNALYLLLSLIQGLLCGELLVYLCLVPDLIVSSDMVSFCFMF